MKGRLTDGAAVEGTLWDGGLNDGAAKTADVCTYHHLYCASWCANKASQPSQPR
jgi:hypothetical protein